MTPRPNPSAPEHPWLAALSRSRPCLNNRLVRTIDPRDEMLEVAYLDNGGDLDASLVAYFAAGEQIASSISQLIVGRFGSADALSSLLDFGSGFGRVTRFFVEQLGHQRIWASDIVPEAVEFQRKVLRAHSFLSASDPCRLVPPRRFDLIYVGSLFTHLPHATFELWLRTLATWLEPGGLLALTVHGPSLLPPEHRMPTEGLFFKTTSESHTIDPRQYGSTWVSHTYLEATFARIGGLQWRLVPRGICNYQDLVLVADTDTPSLSALTFDPGPVGKIEAACVQGGKNERDFRLVLSGWAMHQSPRLDVAAIEVALDGEPVASITQFEARQDLVEPVDEVTALLSGWSLQAPLPLPVSRSSTVLTIDALSSGGTRTLLYCGSIERLLHLNAAENFKRHRQRLYELAAIIQAMKQSLFWRMRRHWLRVKSFLGATDDDPNGPAITETESRSKKH